MKMRILGRTVTLMAAGAACAAAVVFGAGRLGLCRGEVAAFRILPLPSPAGADSASPSLTVAHGRMILSWVDGSASRPSVRFAERLPSGWSEVGTVASEGDLMVNAADVPSVRALGGSALVAAWLQQHGGDAEAYDLRLTWSQDEGRTWSAPLSPHDDGTRTQHGFASLFDLPGGGTGVVWLDGRTMAPGLSVLSGPFSMALRAATYAADRTEQTETALDSRVCDCCPLSTAATSEGVVVAFRDRGLDEVRDIKVARLAGGAWAAPISVHDDGWKIAACPVNGPSISADGDRVVVAWFTAEGGRGRTLAAFSNDGGRSFGPPVRVDEVESVGRPQAALLPDGAAAVSWIEFVAKRSQLQLRRIEATGRRSAAVTVASGMGAQHPRLARRGDDLVLAWVERGVVTTARAEN